jgi:hypothetical protein
MINFSLDRQREMLIIAGTVSTVSVATLLLRNWFSVSIALAVGVGFVTGYGCVLGLQLEAVQKQIGWPRREKILGGWFVVVVLSVIGVGLLAETYLVLLGIQPLLSMLGGGMIVYNAGQLSA